MNEAAGGRWQRTANRRMHARSKPSASARAQIASGSAFTRNVAAARGAHSPTRVRALVVRSAGASSSLAPRDALGCAHEMSQRAASAACLLTAGSLAAAAAALGERRARSRRARAGSQRRGDARRVRARASERARACRRRARGSSRAQILQRAAVNARSGQSARRERLAAATVAPTATRRSPLAARRAHVPTGTSSQRESAAVTTGLYAFITLLLYNGHILASKRAISCSFWCRQRAPAICAYLVTSMERAIDGSER